MQEHFLELAFTLVSFADVGAEANEALSSME